MKNEKKVKGKRTLALVLTLVLAVTVAPMTVFGTEAVTTAVPAPAKTSDLTGHWAENTIKEAESLGIVSGYGDGVYKPEAFIKREEFYTLLTKVMTAKPDTTTTVLNFPDVVKGEWYEPVIKTAVAAGIAKGYEDGTFGVGRIMSRQECAKVVASVVQTKNIPAGSPTADAVKDKALIGDWALPYVNIMFQKKYMKGDDQNMLHPTNALKRCEAITILLNVKKNETIIAANADKIAEDLLRVDGLGCREVHKVSEGAITGMFTKGEGSKTLPYIIETEDQLNHMRMHLNEENTYFALSKDITITKDMTTTKPDSKIEEDDWRPGNFRPIGTKTQPFKGKFDGRDHSIKGLKISGISFDQANNTNPGKAAYAGLFGYVGKAGTVENLTVNDSTVDGSMYTGGISGYNEGNLKACALGENATVNGQSYTGGITGYSETKLTELDNRGTVNGGDKTGGVVGYFLPTNSNSAEIKDCINSGIVKIGEYNGGGIVGTASGKSEKITITGCENTGDVKGTGVNGGIAGYLYTAKAEITKCKNSGDVEGNGAGGIVGNNEGLISFCQNTGSIKGKINGGGIAAYQQSTDSRITKCANEGNVYSNSLSGGITGENSGRIDNCYNVGKVDGENNIGGIIGKNMSSVTNVYNAGRIIGTNAVGALIGRNVSTVSNSYYLETSSTLDIGLMDGSASKSLVNKLTEEQLFGNKTIKTSDGEKQLIDVMNGNNKTNINIQNKTEPDAVWEYKNGSYKYPTIIGL